MKSFTEFLSEETKVEEPKGKALKHLRHVEDNVLYDGHPGTSLAAEHLDSVHKSLLGKKGGVHISTKWDGCIHANTELLIFNGINYSLKTIKEITDGWTLGTGFLVLGMTNDNQVAPTKILDKNVTSVPKQWLKIEFDNGGFVIITEDHKFFTDKGEVEAKDLTDDHDIINFSIN